MPTEESAATDFAGASTLFEAAWYGNDDTGPAEDSQMEELRRRVLAEAGAR